MLGLIRGGLWLLPCKTSSLLTVSGLWALIRARMFESRESATEQQRATPYLAVIAGMRGSGNAGDYALLIWQETATTRLSRGFQG